jgi:threonine dehydrogenase-like Zn-dependent dehydrogenase
MPTYQKMRAAVLAAPKQIRLCEIEKPEPGPGQVLIKVEGCGICGSNLAPWEGRPWFKYPFEAGAPGHEGWGVIDSIGEGVADLRIGDRVAFLSYHSFAEFDIADQHSVVRLSSTLATQPFPGEALGCAMNVFRRSQIRAGDAVGIVGIGFLGALLVGLASRAGARVIAVSRRPFALNIACQFGAQETIPLLDHSRIVERINQLTEGKMCDCVIEAAGAQESLDLAAELTRERGRLIIAGYHQDGPRQVNMQLWNWRGLDVINAHEREPRVYIDGIRAAVDAIARAEFDPGLLYTHTFPFEEIAEAFNVMKERPPTFLKALVKL